MTLDDFFNLILDNAAPLSFEKYYPKLGYTKITTSKLIQKPSEPKVFTS